MKSLNVMTNVTDSGRNNGKARKRQGNATPQTSSKRSKTEDEETDEEQEFDGKFMTFATFFLSCWSDYRLSLQSQTTRMIALSSRKISF